MISGARRPLSQCITHRPRATRYHTSHVSHNAVPKAVPKAPPPSLRRDAHSRRKGCRDIPEDIVFGAIPRKGPPFTELRQGAPDGRHQPRALGRPEAAGSVRGKEKREGVPRVLFLKGRVAAPPVALSIYSLFVL